MYNEEKYFDTEKLLDEALKTEPKFILSENFAEKLAEKVGHELAWYQYFREFLIYLGVIAGLLVVPVVIQFLFFDASLKLWLNKIAENVTLFAGVAFLLVFVLFTDRVLLRYFLHRNSPQQQ